MTTIAIPAAGRTRTAVPIGVARRRAGLLRRRLIAMGLLVVLALGLPVALGRMGAEAELADRVAGHVVLEPGQTLWDVAVATAPDGVDPRRHLADLKELNGFPSSRLDAWTVVLIPAR